jgi:hypothetical protein
MAEPQQGSIRSASSRGIVASHGVRERPALLVAPTTENDFNTLGLDAIPVACLQMADVLFEFDSSFVLPEAGILLQELPAVREQHKNAKGELPPLSVFGHADPVGNDEYNKRLSGRRAKAVVGLLTQDTKVWDALFNDPAGGDNWQTKGVLETMRKTTGSSASTPRSALFSAYMKTLCPFRLEKSDFLARGADPKGKGDFQGCGEFNPLVVLSEDENKSLPKAKRNEENQRNRRVVIYMFAAGTKVKSAEWPCPNADESGEGCKKRFFAAPKGDDRRKSGPARREHEVLEDTLEDTFACRFYDRIGHLSACEVPQESAQCCKFRGVVVDNLDPQQIGRLKVKVPSLLGEEAVFAMPCVPYAGPSVGFLALPPVGANVWVDFEAGDVTRPVWSGCFWGPGEAPPEAGRPETSFFKTTQAILRLEDQSGGTGFAVEVNGVALALGKNSQIELRNGGQKIVVTVSQVSMNDGVLEVI